MAGELEAGTNMTKVAIVVVIVAVIGVAGVVVIMNQTPTQEGITLTVLSRHDVAIFNAYEEAFLKTDFAKAHNIVDIMWKSQAPIFWDDVIDAGGVDVLWGGGPTLFDQMYRDGYLAPLNSDHMVEVIARVPDELASTDMKRYNDDGDVVWVAAAISSFGFTVNHAFLDKYGLPTPNNWTHLAQPVWGSLLPTATIAMGNAPKTTSNTRIYEIITQGMGWDEGWITLARMAGSARLYQGSVETQAAVENQDVGVSMSIDFYGYATQANNPDCEYILPEGESIVNGDPIAIAKNAPNKEAAEAFLDYVLSAEGQSVWFTPGIYRMPVLESAFKTPIGQQNELLYSLYNKTINNSGIDFNDTLSVAINTAFTAYFEAVYNNAHDELTACWKAIVDAYYANEITLDELNTLAAQMGTPVTVEVDGVNRKFTISLATEINNNMIYDSDFYYEMQTKWTAAAVAQYNAVLASLSSMLAS